MYFYMCVCATYMSQHVPVWCPRDIKTSNKSATVSQPHQARKHLHSQIGMQCLTLSFTPLMMEMGCVCVVAVGECEYFPACGKRKEWLWHKRGVLVFWTGFCLHEAGNFHSVTGMNWVCLKHGINSGLNSWDRQLLQRPVRTPESPGSPYSLLTFSKKQLIGWFCVFFYSQFHPKHEWMGQCEHKNFWTAKKTIGRVHRWYTEGWKIFTMHPSDRRLLSRVVHKESQKINPKELKLEINRWMNSWPGCFQKGGAQMANNCFKSC